MNEAIKLITGAVYWTLELLQWAIFINVLLSWVPSARETKFANFLNMITEPILAPIRNILNKVLSGKNMMMIDFSPMVAILLLSLATGLLAPYMK